MRRLFRFHGGVHPPEQKATSSAAPLAKAPIPRLLVMPLHQHIGAPARAAVQVGQRVKKGQVIGMAEGNVSAAVHAPTSGTVTAIDYHSVPHPACLPELSVIIEPDGRDEWVERRPIDYRNLDRNELRVRLRESGVVGLGGAVFPTQVKLHPGRQARVEQVIINGAECEPWITCDDRLMREKAYEIVAGIEVIAHLMQPKEVLIGIEDNKPEAIAAMRQACAGRTSFEVVAVPTLYPSGGAKQLTRILTGKEVPSHMRSTDLGVQVFNVATAYQLHRFVNHGEPMVSRWITVTGNVQHPGNFEVLLGTSLHDLLESAGGALEGTSGYIMGGPMMGLNLSCLDTPVIKSSNCLIAKSEALFPPRGPTLSCIRCGTCFNHCPANLQPQELYRFIKAENFGKAQEYSLHDCIECGVCSYVCPSNIPLVQYFRYAKGEVWSQDRDRRAADRARSRIEMKQQRIEREKQEKAARHAAAAARTAVSKTASDAGEKQEA